MKQLIFLMLLISLGVNAQSPIGAWEGIHTSDEGQSIKTVVIFSDAYQVMAQHEAKTGAFIMTNGGAWKMEGDLMTETIEFIGTGGGYYTTVNGKYTENIEFFSRDNTKVGLELEFDFSLKDSNWHHKGFSSKGDIMPAGVQETK